MLLLRTDTAGDRHLGRVALAPRRMGSHGPDKPRVDAKDRGAPGAVQQAEQSLPPMDQNKGETGETGSSHWQRQPRADAQGRVGRGGRVRAFEPF